MMHTISSDTEILSGLDFSLVRSNVSRAVQHHACTCLDDTGLQYPRRGSFIREGSRGRRFLAIIMSETFLSMPKIYYP